jgi:hypothetical protein
MYNLVVPECVNIEIAPELHVSTNGINSDPLTQFGVVFAALITIWTTARQAAFQTGNSQRRPPSAAELHSQTQQEED